MARVVPSTQFNQLHIFGRYPEINETLRFVDYGGDSDICIEIETVREFNIEAQNSAEFWYTLREEFWPDISKK